MSALSAEIHGEYLWLRGGKQVAAANGYTRARVKSVSEQGVELEAAGRLYRLQLKGNGQAQLRRGSRVMVKTASLPGTAAPSTAGRGKPWGEFKLGDHLGKLAGRSPDLKAAVLDLAKGDGASLRRALRDSGVFYEAKLAALAEGGGMQAAGLARDLKYRLYRLREDDSARRPAERALARITEHQSAARDEELFLSRSAELPYWDGDKVRSLDVLWRRPRGEAGGPCSVTVLLQEGALGTVRLNLLSDRGRLEVNISAASGEACRRLAGDVEGLTKALSQAGWSVSGVNVRQRELAGVNEEA